MSAVKTIPQTSLNSKFYLDIQENAHREKIDEADLGLVLLINVVTREKVVSVRTCERDGASLQFTLSSLTQKRSYQSKGRRH